MTEKWVRMTVNDWKKQKLPKWQRLWKECKVTEKTGNYWKWLKTTKFSKNDQKITENDQKLLEMIENYYEKHTEIDQKWLKIKITNLVIHTCSLYLVFKFL